MIAQNSVFIIISQLKSLQGQLFSIFAIIVGDDITLHTPICQIVHLTKLLKWPATQLIPS